MNPQSILQQALAQHQAHLTRRWFFRDCGVGLGMAALHALLGDSAQAGPARPGVSVSGPLAAKSSQFPAKAKRVIYLFQAGAPSHLELFDHKPELTKWNGKLPRLNCSRGIGRPSSTRMPNCWGPSSSSPVTASRGRKSPSSCLTWLG